MHHSLGIFIKLGKICKVSKVSSFFYQQWALTPRTDKTFQLFLTSAHYNEEK